MSDEKTERVFTVNHAGRNNTVIVGEQQSFTEVWLSIKSWYIPGSVVKITDDKGNTQVFIRE